MKKFIALLFALLLLAFCKSPGNSDIGAPSIEKLPESVRRELKDFKYVPAGTYFRDYDRNLHGSDSFSVFILLTRNTVNHFYIQSTEVSVGDYMRFARSIDYPLNMPDTAKWPYSSRLRIGDAGTHAYYFRHPAFENYPITCISYQQAVNYCRWKSAELNKLLLDKEPNTSCKIVCSLPDLYEWESAANEELFRRFGNYHYNSELVYNTNINTGDVLDIQALFLRNRSADGFDLTAPVSEKRKAWLSHMMGNVAEWTETTIQDQYEGTSFLIDSEHVVFSYRIFAHGMEYDTIPLTGVRREVMNPAYKITKGGSWLHGLYYCNPSALLPVHKDENHPWLGFRMVLHLTPRHSDHF